jgi:hypothetical protein
MWKRWSAYKSSLLRGTSLKDLSDSRRSGKQTRAMDFPWGSLLLVRQHRVAQRRPNSSAIDESRVQDSISRYRQNGLAIFICSGVQHSGSKKSRRAYQNAQSLRSRSRNVQSIQRTKETHAPRRVGVRRGSHGVCTSSGRPVRVSIPSTPASERRHSNSPHGLRPLLHPCSKCCPNQTSPMTPTLSTTPRRRTPEGRP